MKDYNEFLNGFNFIKDISNPILLRMLIYDMKIVILRNKSLVYREGEEAKYVYLIKEGEVEISKAIAEPAPGQPHGAQQTHATTDQSLASQAKLPLRPPNHAKQRRVQLCIKGKGTYFGEEEILKNTFKR